jgi:peroxiredoxin Q/BCP
MLEKNTKAPEFELPDENDQVHKLSDYLGKTVLLYFYPKDDTPGCTTEACEFRNDYGQYEKAGVVILGVSPDLPKSHKKFKEKYDLPFTLLSDVEHKVADLYGVWGKKSMYGKEYFGIKRTTYLIDESGTILEVFKNVKPKGHSQQILAGLDK